MKTFWDMVGSKFLDFIIVYAKLMNLLSVLSEATWALRLYIIMPLRKYKAEG